MQRDERARNCHALYALLLIAVAYSYCIWPLPIAIAMHTTYIDVQRYINVATTHSARKMIDTYTCNSDRICSTSRRGQGRRGVHKNGTERHHGRRHPSPSESFGTVMHTRMFTEALHGVVDRLNFNYVSQSSDMVKRPLLRIPWGFISKGVVYHELFVVDDPPLILHCGGFCIAAYRYTCDAISTRCVARLFMRGLRGRLLVEASCNR